MFIFSHESLQLYPISLEMVFTVVPVQLSSDFRVVSTVSHGGARLLFCYRRTGRVRKLALEYIPYSRVHQKIKKFGNILPMFFMYVL